VKPYGLLGIAIGSALPSLYFNAWVMPRYLARSLGVSHSRIFAEGQLRGLLTGAGLFVIGLLILRIHTPTAWPTFFLEVVLTLVVSSPMVWLFGLTSRDRDMVLATFNRRRARNESD